MKRRKWRNINEIISVFSHRFFFKESFFALSRLSVKDLSVYISTDYLCKHISSCDAADPLVMCLENVLTHPDFSKTALSQFQVQAEGLSGNLPGILGQPLGLRFSDRTHIWKSVTQSIGVLWKREKPSKRDEGECRRPSWTPCIQALTAVMEDELLQAGKLGSRGDVETSTVQLPDLVMFDVQAFGVIVIQHWQAICSCKQTNTQTHGEKKKTRQAYVSWCASCSEVPAAGMCKALMAALSLCVLVRDFWLLTEAKSPETRGKYLNKKINMEGGKETPQKGGEE